MRMASLLALATLSCASAAHSQTAWQDPPTLAAVRPDAGIGDRLAIDSAAVASAASAMREVRVADARAEWATLTSFMGLPRDTRTVPGAALAARVSEGLAAADADGDGVITAEEIRIGALSDPARMDSAIVMLSMPDLDADGDVTQAEAEAFRAANAEAILALDAMLAVASGSGDRATDGLDVALMPNLATARTASKE